MKRTALVLSGLCILLAYSAVWAAQPSGLDKLRSPQATETSAAAQGVSEDYGVVEIDCDPSPCAVSALSLSDWTVTESYNRRLELPLGTYDIIIAWSEAGFDPSRRWHVIREGLAVESGLQRIEVSRDEARNRISFVPYDENGMSLASGPNLHETFNHILAREGTSSNLLWSKYGTTIPGQREIFFSDLSPAYTLSTVGYIESSDDPYNQPSYLYLGGPPHGISGDFQLGGPDTEFHRVVLVQRPEPDAYEWELLVRLAVRPQAWLSEFSWILSSLGGGCRGPALPMVPPYEQVIFMQEAPNSMYGVGYLWMAPREPEGVECDHTNLCPGTECPSTYQTPYMIYNDGVRGYLPGPDSTPVFVEHNSEIQMGIGPGFWLGKLSTEPSLIDIGSSVGYFLLPFVGQTGGIPGSEIHHRYSLFDGYGNPLFVDRQLPSGLIQSHKIIHIDPGAYRMETAMDHEEWGSPRATLWFDTRAQDSNPPYLTRFRLGDPERRVETLFYPGGELTFRAGDDEGDLQTVAVSYLSPDGYRSLPVIQEGQDYRVVFPASMEILDQSTDLKLRIVDAAGNALEATVTVPAKSIMAEDSRERDIPALATE